MRRFACAPLTGRLRMAHFSDVIGANLAATTKSAGGVRTALKSAADATGVDFAYLYDVATRESSLNPEAKAKTSSATGLFQFIEQTWLAAVKTYGEAHGLGDAAAAISRTSSGGYRVADPARKAAILDLRRDPDAAAKLAAEMTLQNKSILERKLGRDVSGAELYAAHFLGASGAAKLLSAKPETSAASIAPAAAKANKAIFFDNGRAKSVREVIAGFEATIGAAAAPATIAAPQLAMPKASEAGPRVASFRSASLEPAHIQAMPVQPAARHLTPDHATPARPPLREVEVQSPRSPASVHTAGSTSNLAAAAAAIRRPAIFLSDAARFVDGVSGADPLALMVLQALDPTILGDGAKRASVF